jgi:hypothetical protein
MSNYYKFANGVLVKCKKHELEDLGGLKYLTSKRVSEYSEGRYTEDGWIAYQVSHPCHIGPDGMDATFCPADGRTYDSKSAYYKAVKNKGLQVVGNDMPIQPPKPKPSNINWEKAVAETLKMKPLKGK